MKTRTLSIAAIAYVLFVAIGTASAQPRHVTHRTESRVAREAREREENGGYTLKEWSDFYDLARAIVLRDAPLSPKDRDYVQTRIPGPWLNRYVGKGKWMMTWRLPSGAAVSLEGDGDFFALEDTRVSGGTVSKEQIKSVEKFLEEVREKRKEEEAQPGATDNPDDAQRVRED